MGLYHQLLACQRPTYLTADSLSHGSVAPPLDSIPAAKAALRPDIMHER